MFTLISDNIKLTTSRETLLGSSVITNCILLKEQHPKIYIDKKQYIYIDICAKNLEIIINYLRGYKIDYSLLSEVEINNLKKDISLLKINIENTECKNNIMETILSDETIIEPAPKVLNLKNIFTNDDLDTIDSTESEIKTNKEEVCNNYHNNIKIMNDISTNKAQITENQKYTENLYKKFYEDSESASNIFIKQDSEQSDKSDNSSNYNDFVKSLYSQTS